MSRKSIEGLVKKLGFPSPDKYSQEWEYEVGDSRRCIEWMDDYQQRSDLTDGEKITLMMIIIGSFDSALRYGTVTDKDIFRLKNLLSIDYELHENTLEDWAYWEETNPESLSRINPIIRDVIITARSA